MTKSDSILSFYCDSHRRLIGWSGNSRFMLRVSEIFHSVQGEGAFAGTPSVFLRTTGCNLRCWFCDTPYTSWEPEGVQRPWDDVLNDVLDIDCEHVVITGGEPLLQPDVVPLSHALRAAHRIVTVETAGTVFRPVAADLMSISPKLHNSMPEASRSARWSKRHEDRRINRVVLGRFVSEYRTQLKFVIDRPEDLIEVEGFINQPPELPRGLVWVMPQARTFTEVEEKAKWLIPAAKDRGFLYSSRMQIELFGNVRGT